MTNGVETDVRNPLSDPLREDTEYIHVTTVEKGMRRAVQATESGVFRLCEPVQGIYRRETK